MKKMISVLLLAFVIMTSSHSTVNAGWSYDFWDLTPNNSHYSSIYYLAEQGIIKGFEVRAYDEYEEEYYSYYEFRSDLKVTNAQVAIMLVRTLGLEYEDYTHPNYLDVSRNHYAYKEIAIATDYGFFDRGQAFKPDEPMTRERVAETLAKGFDLSGYSSITFKDVPTSSKYYQAIQALAANNITIGYNGKFSPKQSVTRGEFASFLTRTILPEARPTNETYTYNSGLVPENYGSIYLYSEEYEGYKSYYVFDSVYDHSRDDDHKLTRVDGVTNYEFTDEQSYHLIEYYEDAEKFSVSAMMPYITVQMELKYPVKANAFHSRSYYDYNLEENVTETYKVRSTNDIFMAGNVTYTDVITVDVVRYSNDSEWFTTFHLVKGIGIVGLSTELGHFELENLDYGSAY